MEEKDVTPLETLEVPEAIITITPKASSDEDLSSEEEVFIRARNHIQRPIWDIGGDGSDHDGFVTEDFNEGDGDIGPFEADPNVPRVVAGQRSVIPKKFRKAQLKWMKLMSHKTTEKIIQTGNYLRFDVCPEYFKHYDLMIKSRDYYTGFEDPVADIEFSLMAQELIYSDMKLEIPIPPKENTVTFLFEGGKTLAVDLPFLKLHSPVLAMFATSESPETITYPGGTPFPEGDPRNLFMMEAGKIKVKFPRKYFKNLLRILYNPGKCKDYMMYLLRGDNLECLLELARALCIDQFKVILEMVFPTYYKKFQNISSFYSMMVGETSANRNRVVLGEADKKELETLLAGTPGKWCVSSASNLFQVLDRFQMTECIKYILETVYKTPFDVRTSPALLDRMRHGRSISIETWSPHTYSVIVNHLTSLLENFEEEIPHSKGLPRLSPVYPRTRDFMNAF